MDKLLKDIIETFGVSGHENSISKLIRQEIKKLGCEICEDKLGNIIAKKGSGNNKIMVSANMDTKGLIVYYVEDDGRIRIHNLGEFDASSVLNRTVSFESGIVGEIKSEAKEKHEFRDLYVDLGFKSRKETLQYVKEGDAAAFEGNTYEQGDNIVGPNISNRINCYMLLKVLEKLKVPDDKEIYFVFSVQGQLEARGARAAAFDIKPDYFIALNTENEDIVKLNEGPVVVAMQRGLIMHKDIKNLFVDKAKEHNIDIQLCVSNDISDASTAHKEVGGIPSGTLAVPCKDKNKDKEAISLKDIKKGIDLIIKCL